MQKEHPCYSRFAIGLISLLFSVLCLSSCERERAVRGLQGVTSYYVDPDWAGANSGSLSEPWSKLDNNTWNTINAALSNGDVTIYFSALKADGTQQARTLFLQCRRVNPSLNRLTIDGYSKYNSNTTSPNWLANPDPDINHAYLNGKVFKVVGGPNPIDGNMAMGWTRVDGQDFVTHNGLAYCCIESHLAAADNEPGIGTNWKLYWDQHGSASTEWASGAKYKCYPKQNNVTIRGFEITGKRTTATGDNLIFEYNYIHDTTDIGPGLYFDYTSLPDGPAAQIIMRPSTNAIFRHFKIQTTFGEALYLGSINPDAPAEFQAAHGNQHSHILIEDFVIEGAGTGGGQGDSIDCKHGITYLTIRRGDISKFGRNGVGIGLPETATNIDQHNVIESNYIHDPRHDDEYGGQYGIYAGTGGATSTSMWGYNGYTIRNNVIANCRRGIQYSSDGVQPVVNGFIYNNTIYGTYVDAGLAVNCQSNCEVKNNFVFGGAGDPQAQISANCVSDYNAHDTGYKGWISNSEGSHTKSLTNQEALNAVVDATAGNFHLKAGSPLIGAGQEQATFNNDIAGATRTPPWDIGAYAYSGGNPSPSPTSTAAATATATPAANTPTPTPNASPTANPSPTPTPQPTVSPTPQPTTIPVSPPSNLTAKVVRGKDVELLWQDNSSNENAFEIQRSEQVNGNCLNWPVSASVPSNSTNYTDTTTQKKKIYCYRVRARGIGGMDSAWSNTATARP